MENKMTVEEIKKFRDEHDTVDVPDMNYAEKIISICDTALQLYADQEANHEMMDQLEHGLKEMVVRNDKLYNENERLKRYEKAWEILRRQIFPFFVEYRIKVIAKEQGISLEETDGK